MPGGYPRDSVPWISFPARFRGFASHSGPGSTAVNPDRTNDSSRLLELA